METKIMLSLEIRDEDTMAGVFLTVSRWDGGSIKNNAVPYEGKIASVPLDPTCSTIPYAITNIRNMTDAVINALMDAYQGGQILLMHEVPERYSSLFFACGVIAGGSLE